jgi:hypothetical protein
VRSVDGPTKSTVLIELIELADTVSTAAGEGMERGTYFVTCTGSSFGGTGTAVTVDDERRHARWMRRAATLSSGLGVGGLREPRQHTTETRRRNTHT